MQTISPLVWRSASFTDPGKKRALNEDALLDSPELGLWAIADGMGGHESGAQASKTVIEYLQRFEGATSLPDTIDTLETLILKANEALFKRRTQSNNEDLTGSTVALLTVFHHYGFILWAGDSRVYRLRRGQLTCLSEDHSIVQELVKAGHISEAEAASHPSASVILRAIGGDSHLHLDMDYIEIKSGDRFLICSDGLYKDVPETTISAILRTEDVEDANRQLRAAALNAGGSDNISSIVVDFHLPE